MIYKVLRIDEDIDYGCEERLEGEPVMAIVTLQRSDEDEEKTTFRIEDVLLYEREIYENDLVYMDEEGMLAKVQRREKK